MIKPRSPKYLQLSIFFKFSFKTLVFLVCDNGVGETRVLDGDGELLGEVAMAEK